MAEAIVSAVVTRLGNLLVEEAIYLNDVSDKVRDLQTELGWMQCYLKDAEKRENDSAIVKNGIAETKDLAYDAEDVIAAYALTVESRKGRGVQKVLKRCACILDEGITVHQVGSKIDAIKTRISNLKDSFEKYGIKMDPTPQAGGLSSLNETQLEQRETYPHLQYEVVGFDNDLKELVEFLLKEEERDRVASIRGMGGLGKTTLAKMVYNDTRVKQHFECRAWACISQQCQTRLVWNDILISLLSLEEEEKEKEKKKIRKLNNREIVEKLCEVQKKSKCLVILDDIWDIDTLRHLLEAFPRNDTKSRILLTSRNEAVHRHVDPRGLLYKLLHLDDAKSLELLEKIVISPREDSAAKSLMRKFGKEMIKYCGGLPLAITVLGGLLATKQTLEEWQAVLGYAKSYLCVEDVQVNNVLALSYNDLPSYLKPCFLYFGHFPEDFEIRTKELIHMWIAEGFISQIHHKGGGREDTMDDIGDRYLRELMQRYMVQEGKKDSLGRIKTCRMHDLMGDFCVLKAQEENFLQITNPLSMKQREAQIHKVRRLAMISKSSGDNSITGIEFNKYPHLRSLIHFLPPQGHKSYFKESCFKKCKLVRVLHLENFKELSGELPKDIGCLIHLRYLSLKHSNINKVPSSISNLNCLETLDLRSMSNESNICVLLFDDLKSRVPNVFECLSKQREPNVFKNMIQLKHLYLPTKYEVYCKLELGHLSSLQTLENVQPETIETPAGFELSRLRVLRVINAKAQDAMQMLISSCPLLEQLNLYNLRMEKLPEFHGNLAKLSLWYSYLKNDPMPTLEKLPNLKSLRLYGHSYMVGTDMVCSAGGFPLLQSLLISYLEDLEEWRVGKGAMPILNNLQIRHCRRLRTIPNGLRFITTLQKLEIKSMPISFKNSLVEGGSDYDKVKHVPSLVFE